MKNKLQEYQDLVKSREELAASLSNEERYWGNVDQYTRKIIPITDDIVKELNGKCVHLTSFIFPAGEN